MPGFQTTMYANQAIGIEGDWASANPMFSQLVGPTVYAGAAGVSVGRFAWANGNVVSNKFNGGRLGFVHRDQPSLIVPQGLSNWLPQSTLLVPPGLEVTLFDNADVLMRFAAGATPGQTVYANYADGTGVAASAASTITASSFSIAPATGFSGTGGIRDGILTISAVSAGSLYPGSALTMTGSISGTQVVAQLLPLVGSEVLGGIGRYYLNYDDGVLVNPGTAVTGAAGLLTVATTGATTWGPGFILSGTGVTANTLITADASTGAGLTGNGGVGTYIVNPSQTASTGTLTGTTNVATKWVVATVAAAGELAKISQRS